MNIEIPQPTSTNSLFFGYIFPFLKWGLIIYSVICLLIYIDGGKKTKKEDIKIRMWKKFQFANFELLPDLNPIEKRDMLMTLDNTIFNAELFKLKKLSHFENEFGKIKKSAKKRVSFTLTE